MPGTALTVWNSSRLNRVCCWWTSERILIRSALGDTAQATVIRNKMKKALYPWLSECTKKLLNQTTWTCHWMRLYRPAATEQKGWNKFTICRSLLPNMRALDTHWARTAFSGEATEETVVQAQKNMARLLSLNSLSIKWNWTTDSDVTEIVMVLQRKKQGTLVCCCWNVDKYGH